MANISSADGKIRFSEDFVKRYEKEIEEWIDTVNKYSRGYGISSIEDYMPGKTDYRFSGEGRWTFDSTLTSWGLAVYDGRINKTVDILKPCLIESKESVDVEFTDYEPGCEVLYGETVRLSAKPGMEEPGKYCAETVEESDISYNHRSTMEYGYEDGFDLRNSSDYDTFIDFAKRKGKRFSSLAPKIAEKIDKDPEYDGCTYEWEADDWEDSYADIIEEIEGEEEKSVIHYHVFV